MFKRCLLVLIRRLFCDKIEYKNKILKYTWQQRNILTNEFTYILIYTYMENAYMF